jgi:hypothetical protein
MDAYSKSNLIVSGIIASGKESGHNLFFRFCLGWLNCCFGKYAFERFLLRGELSHSLYKSLAVMLAILFCSSEIPGQLDMDDLQVLTSSMVLILCGGMLEYCPRPQKAIAKPATRARKAKLAQNAKA